MSSGKVTEDTLRSWLEGDLPIDLLADWCHDNGLFGPVRGSNAQAAPSRRKERGHRRIVSRWWSGSGSSPRNGQRRYQSWSRSRAITTATLSRSNCWEFARSGSRRGERHVSASEGRNGTGEAVFDDE